MKTLFLKDMRYRQARVVLTALGITVLISLILLLGGIMNGMRIQARQYVESTGADLWISAEGSGGAFIGFSLIVEEYMAFLNAGQGLVPDSASPLVFAQARPNVQGKSTKAIIVGYKLGKLGGPKRAIEGRMFTPSILKTIAPKTQSRMKWLLMRKWVWKSESRLPSAMRRYGLSEKRKASCSFWTPPLLFMDVRIAQKLLLGTTPHVNMMVAKVNENFPVPEVATQYDEFETIETRTLKQTVGNIIEYYVDEPMKAVQFLRVMLWLAAGILVGMITYVTMLEKTQEIGVLKAIGAANSYVMALLLKQVALMSAVGVILGLILSYIFATAAPIFVAIHFFESVIVACISFVVCCGSGYLAARKAITVDPMIAFRGEI